MRLRAHGLDYASIRKTNPHALVLNVPAFGSRGPDAEFDASDELVAARAGIAGSQWARSGNPVPLVFPAASYSAGVMGAKRGGRGAHRTRAYRRGPGARSLATCRRAIATNGRRAEAREDDDACIMVRRIRSVRFRAIGSSRPPTINILFAGVRQRDILGEIRTRSSSCRNWFPIRDSKMRRGAMPANIGSR